MQLDEYQAKASQFDLFAPTDNLSSPAFLEKILGLVGEAGETADKIKKIIRDKNGQISVQDHTAITKELGDILWYLASVSRYLDTPLSVVAATNLEKLQSRQKRNQLQGEGDDR